MSAVVYGKDVIDSNIIRQQLVQLERVCVDLKLAIDMEEVLAGMNTGVGTATANCRGRFFELLSKSRLNGFLDCRDIGLSLPAVIVGAAVESALRASSCCSTWRAMARKLLLIVPSGSLTSGGHPASVCSRTVKSSGKLPSRIVS